MHVRLIIAYTIAEFDKEMVFLTIICSNDFSVCDHNYKYQTFLSQRTISEFKSLRVSYEG